MKIVGMLSSPVVLYVFLCKVALCALSVNISAESISAMSSTNNVVNSEDFVSFIGLGASQAEFINQYGEPVVNKQNKSLTDHVYIQMPYLITAQFTNDNCIYVQYDKPKGVVSKNNINPSSRFEISKTEIKQILSSSATKGMTWSLVDDNNEDVLEWYRSDGAAAAVYHRKFKRIWVLSVEWQTSPIESQKSSEPAQKK